IYINTALLHRQLREYEMAQEYFNKILYAEGRIHPARMAVFYQYNAINQTSLGNFKFAEGYFEKVFQMREANFPKDNFGWALLYRTYGELLDSLGRFEEADQYFLEAVGVTRDHSGTFNYSTANYLKSAGDHFLRAGDAENALKYYQESLQSLDPGYKKKNPAVNPDPDIVQDHLFLLGLLKQKAATLEILARQDGGNVYLPAAFQAYRLSIQLTGQLRNSYLNDQSKLYLSENERETYEDMVRCAYELYQKSNDRYYLDEAFIAAEKAKYATLVSVLQRSGAIEISGIPDSIKEMEASLQKELTLKGGLLLEARTDTLVDSTRVQQYRSDVFALSDRIEQLNQEME
ncbi:MAG: tetratricopeptide repeat protein, partial [Bacteroidales bacterium]|nr:tetratricopeptide repeat protein [Bacteroidales bacterium]